MIGIENPTYAYTAAFVDELGRGGVRHAVICPGSRSTPLALCFAAQDRIKPWVLIDERGAAFFALGLAKATCTPVVLVCTSGTAAANFLPAIAEARLGRVPLIALTADRPPELRDVGAPQAMDQMRLYGTHAKWFVELALPEASNQALRYARTTANRAMATAAAAPAGAVHVNMPFREPLTPAPIAEQPLPAVDARDLHAWQGRADQQLYVAVVDPPRRVDDATVDQIATTLRHSRQGIIVAGPQPYPDLAAPLTALSARLGWPILADPLSQLRHGAWQHDLIVDSYDAFLRDGQFVRDAVPEIVLRVGAMPVSKPLLQYIQAHPDCLHIVIDGGDGWNDPLLSAAQMIHADPADLAARLIERLPLNRDHAWADLWRSTYQITRQTLADEIERFGERFEGRVFTELARALPDRSTLVVGNSMPIRDCDTFFAGSDRSVRMLGNRGVNGIDGVVSTALGIAAASPDPTVLVLGDLSFIHDLNGLLAAKLHALNLTIVLINNDGGGIFSFLPQAAYPDHFEQLFGTPHGLDFQPAVAMFGGSFERVNDWQAFRRALDRSIEAGGLNVIEVPTDRERNVVLHRQLWHAVGQRLAEQREAKR